MHTVEKKPKIYRSSTGIIKPVLCDGIPMCSGFSGGCRCAQDDEELYCCFQAQGVCNPMVKRMTRHLGLEMAKLAEGRE